MGDTGKNGNPQPLANSDSPPKPVFKRILLKLSGEALEGDQGFGLDPATLESIALQIKRVHSLGVDVALVVGGGNIIRGSVVEKSGIERSVGDYMGMLATVINALALQSTLENAGVPTRVLTAINMSEIGEPFIPRRAERHLEKRRVIIFAAGTGNPYFTTDTAAALRAMEIKADVIVKATKVDGIYDSDPMVNKDARLFQKLTYLEVLEKGLKVMDSTAISLCMDNRMPIIVCNLLDSGTIEEIVLGSKVGTLVSE